MKSLPSWLQNASPATSHLGPRSAKGQLVMCSLVDDGQWEAEERGAGWNQFEIRHTKQYLQFYFQMGRGKGRKTHRLQNGTAGLFWISPISSGLVQSWFGIHAKTVIDELIFVRHLRCKTKVCESLWLMQVKVFRLFSAFAWSFFCARAIHHRRAWPLKDCTALDTWFKRILLFCCLLWFIEITMSTDSPLPLVPFLFIETYRQEDIMDIMPRILNHKIYYTMKYIICSFKITISTS